MSITLLFFPLLLFIKFTLGQSRSIVDREVGKVLMLREELKAAEAILRGLQDRDHNAEDYDVEQALGDARAEVETLKGKLAAAERRLGPHGQRLRLDQAIKDPMLAAKLNAFALKERLRQRLVHRKFEYAKLESSARRHVLGASSLTHQFDYS